MEQPIAYRIPLDVVKQAPFVKGSGWDSSFCEVKEKQVQRINVIGTVIGKQASASGKFKSFLVDDSTSHMSIRCFDDISMSSWEQLDMGNFVRVVGNLREYMGEVYIAPISIKLLDSPKWLDHHKTYWSVWKDEEKQEEVVVEEAVVAEEVSSPEQFNGQQYLQLIKSLDTGEGAPVDEIKKKLDVEDPSKLVHQLIVQGEIFEIRPGYVKTLF